MKMAKYIEENPQITVNGFLQAGIAAGALDHTSNDLQSQEDTTSDLESDFIMSEEEGHNDYNVVKIQDD